MRRIHFLVPTLILFLSAAAAAQESRSEISVQGTGFFTRDATGNGTSYGNTESGGLLTSYRYHLKSWLSAEAVYGIDRSTAKYFTNSASFRIQSDVHQATGGLVVNLPAVFRRRLNPYALAGGGALIFDPTSSRTDTVAAAQTEAKGVFVYGGGVNYSILKRVSLRAEYRGLVYGTTDFGFGALRTNAITHTAQPSIGLAFQF